MSVVAGLGGVWYSSPRNNEAPACAPMNNQACRMPRVLLHMARYLPVEYCTNAWKHAHAGCSRRGHRATQTHGRDPLPKLKNKHPAHARRRCTTAGRAYSSRGRRTWSAGRTPPRAHSSHLQMHAIAYITFRTLPPHRCTLTILHSQSQERSALRAFADRERTQGHRSAL